MKKSVLLKEAFNRLAFTIKNQNRPNQSDVEALNVIIENFNKIEQKTVTEHLLFAKLYAVLHCEFTNHYGNVEFANKMLNKELIIPLSVHIEKLKLILKNTKTAQFFQDNEIKDSFLENKSSEELKEIAKRYPKICNAKEFFEYFTYWDDKRISEMLFSNINLSIQNFKNYD